MKKRILIPLALLALALALPGATTQSADAQETVTLRIATLAPNGSPWMRVFNAWNRSLQEETGGTVQLRIYPGGSQGDERDFIRKMRDGQMDGAAVTTTGLGQIARSTLVLSVPGIITEYDQMDRVRRRLARTFDNQFTEAGYTLLGWGDVGKTRMFSTRRIEQPSELRQTRPWAWRDQPLITEFYRVVGANGRPMGVNEVYPALQTGMIDTFIASAVSATALQWHTRVRYATQQNSGLVVGATVVRSDKIAGLTEAQREALMSTSSRAHRALRRAIRREDDRALATIQRQGITLVDTAAHEAAWQDVQTQTRERMAGRIYSRSLLNRVVAAAAQ